MAKRYEYLKKIATGGQGEVFLVRDTLRQNRRVALKRVRADAARREELASEFNRLSQLRHPSLARAYDFGEDSEGAFFTSEYIEGPDFISWARGETEESILRAAVSLLRALALIHDRDLVHGDVSPSNVIVCTSDKRGSQPKLLDLGGALRPGQAGGATTAGYAAPEVLTNRGALPTSDLYSFGVLLAVALFRNHPFGEEGASEVVKRQLSGKIDVPDPKIMPIAGLCLDLVQPDPALRPQSSRIVLERLAALTEIDFAVNLADFQGGDLPTPKIVGRTAELSALKGLIDQMDDPRGIRVALITGRDGSGRSTLLAEIIRHAQLSGMHVVGHPDGPANAGDLLSEILRQAESGAIPGPSRRILAKWMKSDESKSEIPLNLPPQSVGYAAVDTLAAASANKTILVAIDDTKTSGKLAETIALTLARALVRERQNRPAAILVAAFEPDSVSEEWQALSPLVTQLDALGKGDIDLLVESMLGGVSFPPDLMDSAFLASGGIPGLAEQFVRQAAGPNGVFDVDTYAEQILAKTTPKAREILAMVSLVDGSCPASIAGEIGLDREEAERLFATGLLFETTRSTGPGIRVSETIGLTARNTIGETRLEALSAHLAQSLEKSGYPSLAARLFAESGSPAHAMDIYGALGTKHLHQGDLGGASECFERAKDVAKKHKLSGAWARDAVKAWKAIGRHDLALEGLEVTCLTESAKQSMRAELISNQGKHKEALAIARQVKRDDDNATFVSGIIAACELQLGNHETALSTVKEALDAIGKEEETEHTARLSQIGGLACAYLGRFEEADTFFARAEREFEKTADGTGQIKVLANRGFLERRRGHLTAAHSLYNRTISLAQKTGDRPREGLNLMNRATVSLVIGDIGAAHEDYLAALDIAVVLGNGFARSQVEVNLADLLSGLGNPAEALKLTGQAMERCRALGQGRLETRAQLVAGVALLRAGATHRAERRLLEARRRFAAAGDDIETSIADLHLADLYLQLGKFPKAVALADNVALLAKTKNRPGDYARSIVIQARSIAASDGDLQKALGMLREAEEIARQESLPDELWRIMVHRARIQKQSGADDEGEETLAAARNEFEKILAKVPSPYAESYSTSGEAADLKLENFPKSAPSRGEHQGQNLERLMEINRELTREHDPKRLLSLIMEHAVELTGAERGMVVMPKSDGLEPVISYQISDEEDVSFSRSVAEKVVVEGRAVLAIDAMGDSRFRAFTSVHTMKLRSILAVPLSIRRRVVGVVYLDSRLQAGIFSDGDRQLLEAFGSQAAIALETARLITENAKRCEDLQEANLEIRNLSTKLEEKLEHNEAKLRRVGALLQKTQKDQSERLKENGIIGRAPTMQNVMRVIDRIALTDVPIYIFGGSGTGKELVARACHAASERSENPFVPVNCGALPSKLLASELFGHVRGAFTGAVRNRPGLFRLAHQGTLFLDEVVDMDPEMQAHLLRVLQDGKFRSLGGNEELSVDVRIVSASNRDLEKEVRLGNFREDLFYRLNVVRIDVPALDERREDIPLLADFFAQRHGGHNAPKFSRLALDILVAADWPGNVRELENEVLRAMTMAEPGQPIKPEDLSPRFGTAKQRHSWPSSGSLKERVDAFERMLIEQVLRECDENATRAAKQLNISRAGFYKKLEKHNINRH